MSGLANAFARCRAEGRLALIAYVMAGYPEADATLPLVEALAEGGFDVIEIGVPFSDPLADGPSIQRAGQRALANGVRVETCLRLAAEVRDRVGIPTLLMGYLNPFWRFGLPALSRRAAESGVDGFIVPDLPLEESGPFESLLSEHGLHNIRLVAPTAGPGRLAQVVAGAGGLVYCVSVAGVTGARGALSADLAPFLGEVRRHTDLPLAVGFGLSRPEHVAALVGLADGAVVGSAIVDLVDALPVSGRAAGLRAYAASLREAASR